jgi:hypothetical protein
MSVNMRPAINPKIASEPNSRMISLVKNSMTWAWDMPWVRWVGRLVFISPPLLLGIGGLGLRRLHGQRSTAQALSEAIQRHGHRDRF